MREFRKIPSDLTSENIKDIYTLSAMQAEMYFQYTYNPSTTAHFEQLSFHLSGELNIPMLEQSLDILFQRYDILRTVFNHEKVNQPLQVVLKYRKVDFHFENLRTKKGESGTAKDVVKFIEDFKRTDRRRLFDLNKDVLMRLGVFEVGENEFEFIWSYHHILMDGWCIGILISEFFEIYTSLLEQRNYRLPPVKPYREYIQWLEGKDKKAAADFWNDYLEGYRQPAGLLRKKAIQPEGEYREEKVVEALGAGESETLSRLAAENDITLNTAVQVSWGLSLAKYNCLNDVVFGAVVSGRPSEIEGVETMVGLFINSVPVRIHFRSDEPLKMLMRRVQTDFIKGEPFHYYPLAEIQAEHPLKNDLLDHLIGFQNYPLIKHIEDQVEPDSKQHSGFKLDVTDLTVFEHSNYDFGVRISAENQVQISLEYNGLAYDKALARRLAAQFVRNLKLFCRDENINIDSLLELTSDEKRTLLVDLNNTGAAYPLDDTIQDLFERRAREFPDNIAVVEPGGSDGPGTILTYRQLNSQANRLARVLRRKGVGRGELVGLLLERSPRMITAILAVLKAGAAYLPIDLAYPREHVLFIMQDANITFLMVEHLTLKKFSYTDLQGIRVIKAEPHLTARRPQIQDFDSLPIPDRSLVNHEEYNKFIGHGLVKHKITLQGTRGCPYNCCFCHKIWPKSHVIRSAESIFEEVKRFYDIGVKRFSFVDDIFNLNVENSSRFFNMVINHKMHKDIQILFPGGLRGDIMTPDYLDLMVEAGTMDIAVALETASYRLQKLIGKNLNIDRLKENVDYICRRHPQVILEVFTMHGFPTETEEEAMSTLNLLKTMKWVDFPSLSIVTIYPNTDMAKLAVKSGISWDAIIRSEALQFHEVPETLPFSKGFTTHYQTEYLTGYFLLKERLLAKLPYQLKLLTEDEIVQKYHSYLPHEIRCFQDVLDAAGISEEELGEISFVNEEEVAVPDFNARVKKYSSVPTPAPDALKIMHLDLSQYFRGERAMLFDVVDPPLGLMYLLTYINEKFGPKIDARIAKSRFDFDSFEELRALLEEFDPDIIALRTLIFYKDFFHETLAFIKDWGFNVPIICGGPYCTSSYDSILQDGNVDIIVMGEGELIYTELLEKILENEGKIPGDSVLREIPGLAFIPSDKRKALSDRRQLMVLEHLTEMGDREEETDPETVNQPADPAYVIYTSGSTGKPKGAVITHENIIRLMTNDSFPFMFSHRDVWTMFHSYNFDFSVWEMYGALLYGGRLIIISLETARNPHEFLSILRENKVTVLNQTPTVFYNLADLETRASERELNLRYVIFGGEALSPAKLEMWHIKYPDVRLINMFGITETTVHTTIKEVGESEIDLDFSNIGVPLPTVTTYVMDENRRLLPVGVPGELWVGGKGVASGYLNRPALTVQRFSQNPYKTGEMLFRSGDRVRMWDDGEMEYLGRVDFQIKIRGFRVEPGEIETRMLECEDIEEVVVLAKNTPAGDKALHAYFVARHSVNTDKLRIELGNMLPEQFIPSYFQQLEQMPLTPNGKVDRKILAEYEQQFNLDYVAPVTRLHKELVNIWSDILHIKKEKIGIDTDFFELGGHSLNSIFLIARIKKEYDAQVNLADIFEIQTIRKLALYLEEARKESFVPVSPTEKLEYYPLSSAQKRLYFLQQMEPDRTHYNLFMGYPLPENIEPERLESTFNRVIDRHESFRTSFFMLGETVYQRIHPDIPFSLEYHEVNEEEALMLRERFIRPFDLEKPKLLRAGLLKVAGHGCRLFVDMHHIVSDAVSHDILMNDFLALYDDKELPKLRLQYKDYSQWQNSEEQKRRLQQQEAYWVKELGDGIPESNLPLDNDRPVLGDPEIPDRLAGSLRLFSLTAAETESLRILMKQENSTLFMVLLAMINVFLSKICSQEDIAVGSAVANRGHADLEQIIGVFVNTLVLLNHPTADKTFLQLLRDTRIRTLEAFDNQDYQFEDLVEKLNVRRRPDRNPLFDVGFSVKKMDETGDSVTEENVREMESEDDGFGGRSAMLDLICQGIETRDSIMFAFIYRKKLFNTDTIERFVDIFREVTAAVVDNPDIQLKEIKMAHNLVVARSTMDEADVGAFEF